MSNRLFRFPSPALKTCVTRLVLLAALVAPECLMAQTPPDPFTERRTVTALRLPEGGTIQLDGRLDEPVWRDAAPATVLVQQNPVNGAPATDVNLLIAEGNVGDEEREHLTLALQRSTASKKLEDQSFEENLAQAKSESLLTGQANAASLLRRDGVTLDGYAAAARAAQGRQGDKAAPGGGS